MLLAGATMESRARPLPSLPLSLGNRKYTWAGRGSTVCVVYVQKDLVQNESVRQLLPAGVFS